VLELHASRIDLVADRKVIWHAAEVLWDSKEFADAAKLVALWRRTVEKMAKEDGVDSTESRIWVAILSAELEHRRRHYDVAVHYARWALTQIRKLAGGEQEVHRMTELGSMTAITEMQCAALAIAIPAGRVHFRRRPTLRVQYVDHWVEEAQCILRRDLPPPFLRVHALVIQTYFAIAERRHSQEEARWLDRLERFDDLVRPKTQRGQATKELRHVARARFEGDGELELTHALKAAEDLEHLPRHVEALTANEWWPKEAASR
jgi:hypothetical protein